MKSSLALHSSRVFSNAFGMVARFGGALLLISAAPVLAACNGITGAGDLVFNAGGGGSGGDGSGAGVTNGASVAASSGAGVTSGASSSSGAGTTTGASSGAGSNCTYPTGTYGAQVGSIIPPNLTWQGYREGATTVGDVAISEYFDCDGTKGVNALYVATSATWCGNCQQEASEFPQLMTSSWGAMGIKVLTLMIEDQNGAPATTQTALQWRDNFGLTATSVVADPSFSMAGGGGTIGLPLLLVVDPRTMTVVDRQEGYSGYHGALESLAQQNATP